PPAQGPAPSGISPLRTGYVDVSIGYRFVRPLRLSRFGNTSISATARRHSRRYGRPVRYFNTAGPCRPGEHYLVPPEPRLPFARDFIDRSYFFVVHAPRQTGKTTTLQALARSLNSHGWYAAVHLSCGPRCSDRTAQRSGLYGGRRGRGRRVPGPRRGRLVTL